MDVCLNLAHTICIPGGWIEIGKLLGSAIALILAGIGLNTWNRQIKGSYKFELQKKIIILLSKVKNKIDMVENLLSIVDCDVNFPIIIKLDFHKTIKSDYDELNDYLASLIELLIECNHWVPSVKESLSITQKLLQEYLINIIDLFQYWPVKKVAKPNIHTVIGDSKEKYRIIIANIDSAIKTISK